MKIDLLGHCLICLKKTETEDNNDNVVVSSSAGNGPISKMIFANKVLGQLLLDKSTEKEKTVRDLFNRLHFCNSGGDEGENGEEEEDEALSSPPPLCSSCLEKVSALLKLSEELELKTEELRSRISGDGVGAFESLLRGSEVVEEKTKETTLLLLVCLQEECCDNTATTTPPTILDEMEYDDDDEEDADDEQVLLEGSSGVSEEDEDDSQVRIAKDAMGIIEDDDVVEVPGPPPRDVPVVNISDVDDEEVITEEDQDYNTIFEVEEFIVLPGDLIVEEVVESSPEEIQWQDFSSYGIPQILDLRDAAVVDDGVLESDPSKMFPCTEPNCTKSYTQQRYLLRHIGVAHRTGQPKPFNCQYCGKGYNYSYNLKYHVESQHLRTNYICEICGKGFAGNSHLKKHYLRHLGHKPFQCPNKELGCPKRYTDRSNLNSHMKTCKFSYY